MSEAPTPPAAPEPPTGPTPPPSSINPPAAAPAAPAPEAKYYEAFKDEGLKTDPNIQKYQTAEDLARGYTNAVKRLGADPKSLISLPKGPDDIEGHQAVFKALGAPDKADGYEIKMEGAAPEDLAAAKEFAAEMFAKGPYPASFVSAATEWFSSTVAKQNEALLAEAAAMTAAGEAELKKEWGQAYDQRKGEVGKLLKDLGGEALSKEFEGSVFGDNPKLAIFLGKVLDKMAEPGPRRETSLTGEQMFTPAQHMAKARELATHPALLNASHPQHKEVVKARNDALRAAEAA